MNKYAGFLRVIIAKIDYTLARLIHLYLGRPYLVIRFHPTTKSG